MKRSITTLLVTLTVATAASAVTSTAVLAANGDAAGKFETFDATPKAPRKDAVSNRQIVVEPKFVTPKAPPVASLPEPVENIEPIIDTPAKPKNKPQAQVIEETPAQPELDEQIFAPQTKTGEVKVKMPTVFTEKQKELFNELSPAKQATLVETLIAKHGYDTMYPANTSRTYLDDHRIKQSKAYRDDHYQRGYEDTGYNYSSSYGSSYGSSYYNCQ